MPVTLQSLQADDAAYAKQVASSQAAKAQQEAQAKQPPSFLEQWTSNVGRVTTQMLDSAVSAADQMFEGGGFGEAASRVARDAASGAITGATHIADAAYSFGRSAVQNMTEPGYKQTQRDISGEAAPPAPPSSPIWDHAKASILDFRDAVAVQDPNMVDSLTQGVSQLAVPFAGYSRALAGVHGLANAVIAGGLTDATALGAHDPRMADLIALGRHTEGKLGDALRALAPDGSAVNAYVNYLTDRGDESEAEGRFKNVLDGFGVNMIATPLLTLVGSVLKQGTAGLRYLIENGAASAGDIAGIKSPQMQRGAVGDLSQPRPSLRQGVDPAQPLLDEQVRRDADAARSATKRPALRQNGADPADALYDELVRRDVEAAHAHAGVENNASGESAASLEALHRLAMERGANQRPFFITPDGKEQPLLHTVDAVDVAAPKGHLKVRPDENGGYTILDRGGLPPAHARGLLARFMAGAGGE